MHQGPPPPQENLSPPPPAPIPPTVGAAPGDERQSPRNGGDDYMHSYFGNAPPPPVPGADVPPPPPQPPRQSAVGGSADENSSDLIGIAGEYHHHHHHHQMSHDPTMPTLYHPSSICNGGPPMNGGGFQQYVPPVPQPSNHADTEGTEEEKHDDASSGTASTGTVSEDPKVEVSVVGSPTVFGVPQPIASVTPESDDERVIERCDMGTDQLSLPTSDHRPPKKRFMHHGPDMPAPPSSRISSNASISPSAFGVVPGMFDGIREEPGDLFQQAMCNWRWVHLDGIRMPAVLRDGEAYASVHIVQLKFLSKFPPNIPVEMTAKYTMVSQKMSIMESWIFNTINAVMCKFDLGCQLFSTNDEIVRFADVERFYWAVKALNLRRIMETYEIELRNTSPFNFALLATITQLKKTIEDDLEEVKAILANLQS